jgi:uncharacterized protein (TIGR02611 family)
MPRPLRRISVLLVGTVILVAGLAMLVLPGPGLLLMGMAIAVLALEFDWARRLADAAARTARGLAQRVGPAGRCLFHGAVVEAAGCQLKTLCSTP